MLQAELASTSSCFISLCPSVPYGMPNECNHRQIQRIGYFFTNKLQESARAWLDCVSRYTCRPFDLPGQCCALQSRRCLKAPLHVLWPKGWDGFTHVRILDCIPPPHDLVHLLYSPQAVHVPSDDSTEAASILKLPAENRQICLLWFFVAVIMLSASVITDYYKYWGLGTARWDDEVMVINIL